MVKRGSIASAMREAAGSARVVAPARQISSTVTEPAITPEHEERRPAQASRAGTKAITGHFPPPVRYQLRLLAAEQDRTMEDLLAEALNRLFAAYNKPEIAPTTSQG